MIAAILGWLNPTNIITGIGIGAICLIIGGVAGYDIAADKYYNAIKIADLEAQITNLKNEKAIAEGAAKLAETDAADLEALAAQQKVKIDELVAKLAQSGKKCPIDPADMCRRYGVCPKAKGGKHKASYRPPEMAFSLWPQESHHAARCG